MSATRCGVTLLVTHITSGFALRMLRQHAERDADRDISRAQLNQVTPLRPLGGAAL